MTDRALTFSPTGNDFYDRVMTGHGTAEEIRWLGANLMTELAARWRGPDAQEREFQDWYTNVIQPLGLPEGPARQMINGEIPIASSTASAALASAFRRANRSGNSTFSRAGSAIVLRHVGRTGPRWARLERHVSCRADSRGLKHQVSWSTEADFLHHVGGELGVGGIANGHVLPSHLIGSTLVTTHLDKCGPRNRSPLK